MKKVFFIVFITTTLSTICFPCSMVQLPGPPIAKVNKSTYILVGEVIGFTDVIKSRVKNDGFSTVDKFYGEGRGYKIKPIEVINLPIAPNDYYEFYTFGINSMCSPMILDAYLPVGTKIRLVANEASLLPNRGFENRVRLETKIFDIFSVVNENELFTSQTNIYFDYKNWKNIQEEFQKSKNYGESSDFADFMFLEVNKDILRLEKVKSKTERYEILTRLLYCPNIDYLRILDPSFPSIFELQPINKKPKKVGKKLTSTEKSLLKQRKEIEDSGYFKIV